MRYRMDTNAHSASKSTESRIFRQAAWREFPTIAEFSCVSRIRTAAIRLSGLLNFGCANGRRHGEAAAAQLFTV